MYEVMKSESKWEDTWFLKYVHAGRPLSDSNVETGAETRYNVLPILADVVDPQRLLYPFRVERSYHCAWVKWRVCRPRRRARCPRRCCRNGSCCSLAACTLLEQMQSSIRVRPVLPWRACCARRGQWWRGCVQMLWWRRHIPLGDVLHHRIKSNKYGLRVCEQELARFAPHHRSGMAASAETMCTGTTWAVAMCQRKAAGC